MPRHADDIGDGVPRTHLMELHVVDLDAVHSPRACECLERRVGPPPKGFPQLGGAEEPLDLRPRTVGWSLASASTPILSAHSCPRSSRRP